MKPCEARRKGQGEKNKEENRGDVPTCLLFSLYCKKYIHEEITQYFFGSSHYVYSEENRMCKLFLLSLVLSHEI